MRIGHVNDEHGEVLDGVVEGDSVLLNPGSQISDGSRVRPRGP